jgi:hypothetical protein
MRNAAILHSGPRYLYFTSLHSAALSLASYSEFRCTPEHLDYSNLRQHCRQEQIQQTVTKTLTIGKELVVNDLTCDVVSVGEWPAAHGYFADVWKGEWVNPAKGPGQQPRVVGVSISRWQLLTK